MKILCYFISCFEIFRCGIRDLMLTKGKGSTRRLDRRRCHSAHNRRQSCESHEPITAVIRAWLCPMKIFCLERIRRFSSKKLFWYPCRQRLHWEMSNIKLLIPLFCYWTSLGQSCRSTEVVCHVARSNRCMLLKSVYPELNLL